MLSEPDLENSIRIDMQLQQKTDKGVPEFSFSDNYTKETIIIILLGCI